MATRARRAAGWLAALIVVAGAVPAARAQVVPPGGDYPAGSFTYQFADLTGAQITGPITIANVGDFFSFRVYLQQTNVAVTPTINTVGVQGTGARLNYPGGVVRVPAASAANLAANPAYDLVQRGGTGTTVDTTTSAYLQLGLFDPNTPLPLPADTGDSLRMLIGTFRIQALAQGTTTIQLVDPFAAGINNLSGPDPAIPVAGGGFNSVGPGAHNIDPGLLPSSLSVTVGVIPEPSTLALSGLAAAGLAVVRRRKATASVATAA